MIRQRECKTCGRSFEGGPQAFYCPECRVIRRRETARNYQRRKSTGKRRAGRRPKYNKSSCIDAVRKFIEKYNTTDAAVYDRLKLLPNRMTIYNYVGSWTDAVRLAGGIPERKRTKNEILFLLRKSIAEHGSIPSVSEYISLKLEPSRETLRLHGLSYGEAINCIGLPYHFVRGPNPDGHRICPMCGALFRPNAKQRYCSYACRDRFRAWRRRTLRDINNQCPQCGGPMDSPPSAHKSKTSPTYCSRCQAYYRERYRKRNTNWTK